MTEISLKIPAFTIELRYAETTDHLPRFLARINGGAGIAFFLRIMKIGVIALGPENRIGQLFDLRLGLLHAKYVGLLPGQPAE